MLLQAGDKVDNWDVGGADIEAAIRSRGAERFYVLEEDSSAGTTMVVILSDRPIGDFAPPSWRVAKSHGPSEVKIENPSVVFGHLSARYVMAGRGGTRRQRDAICSDGVVQAVLYEVPGAPSRPEDADIPDMFHAMLIAAEGQTMCSRFDGNAETGYQVRDFFPDGRRLLNPDRSLPAGRAKIVPAAPIDSLIKPPPPAPATPGP